MPEQLVGTDPSCEPLVALSYLAGVTSPIRLAKALAAVDQFSLRRLMVGIVATNGAAGIVSAVLHYYKEPARGGSGVNVIEC
ncbi:hypothetical protein [Micromonospora sp. NPDC048830]|uniref:hypothetical protein n=1 Tax=Micromonospora sp. NPDC048830 TaxID=3364257 RepID=UPI00371AC7B2